MSWPWGLRGCPCTRKHEITGFPPFCRWHFLKLLSLVHHRKRKTCNLSESRIGEIVPVALPDETFTSHVEALWLAQSLLALALKHFKIPRNVWLHAKHTFCKSSMQSSPGSIVYASLEVLNLQTRKLCPHPDLQTPSGEGRVSCFFMPFCVSPQNADIHHLGDRYWTWASSHYSSHGSWSRRLSEELELNETKTKQHYRGEVEGGRRNIPGRNREGSIRLTMALPASGLRKQTCGLGQSSFSSC